MPSTVERLFIEDEEKNNGHGKSLQINLRK